jgi:hypothetical protein
VQYNSRLQFQTTHLPTWNPNSCTHTPRENAFYRRSAPRCSVEGHEICIRTHAVRPVFPDTHPTGCVWSVVPTRSMRTGKDAGTRGAGRNRPSTGPMIFMCDGCSAGRGRRPGSCRGAGPADSRPSRRFTKPTLHRAIGPENRGNEARMRILRCERIYEKRECPARSKSSRAGFAPPGSHDGLKKKGD